MSNSKRGQGSDAGATLILVLIIVTVLAVVLGAVLQRSGDAELTSVALSDQGAQVYAADGAAQVALNNLRTNRFDGANTNCFGSGSGTSNVFDLPKDSSQVPIYTSPTGTKYAAAVQCDPDPSTGKGGITTVVSPGTALLSTGDSALSPVGIDVDANGAPAFNVGGKVVANSTITMENKNFNNVNAQGTFLAAGGKAGCTGKGDTTRGPDSSTAPHVDCVATTPADVASAYPNYNATIDSSAAVQSVSCNNTLAPGSTTVKYTKLSPGIYTDSQALSNCMTTLMWFQPGVYYFKFSAGQNLWTMNSPVVAGTLAHTISGASDPLLTLSGTSPQGQCDNPLDRLIKSQPVKPGTEFVFGGSSSFTPADKSFFEICGLLDSDQHIISIYAPTANIKVGPGAGVVIPAQPKPAKALTKRCGSTNSKNDDTAFIFTTYGSTFNMFILGTTYAPNACLDMEYQNGGVEVFHFGLAALQFYFNVNGSSNTTPFINVDYVVVATNPGPVVALLRVYLYKIGQSSPCASLPCSGTPDVVVKVKIPQSDASGSRTLTLLSWTRTS